MWGPSAEDFVRAQPRLSADRATDSSVFRSARPLPGGVGEYVAHLAKYCGCSDECLILTLVYVDLRPRNAGLDPKPFWSNVWPLRAPLRGARARALAATGLASLCKSSAAHHDAQWPPWRRRRLHVPRTFRLWGGVEIHSFWSFVDRSCPKFAENTHTHIGRFRVRNGRS